jgi:hypothetical protein
MCIIQNKCMTEAAKEDFLRITKKKKEDVERDKRDYKLRGECKAKARKIYTEAQHVLL